MWIKFVIFCIFCTAQRDFFCLLFILFEYVVNIHVDLCTIILLVSFIFLIQDLTFAGLNQSLGTLLSDHFQENTDCMPGHHC